MNPDEPLLTHFVTFWHKADPEEYPELEDGDQIIVAVPVMWKSGQKQHRGHDRHAKWHWEYSVLTVSCDEEHIDFLCNDIRWGWDWSDVEYWQKLS